jgi:hypothetical protein
MSAFNRLRHLLMVMLADEKARSLETDDAMIAR